MNIGKLKRLRELEQKAPPTPNSRLRWHFAQGYAECWNDVLPVIEAAQEIMNDCYYCDRERRGKAGDCPNHQQIRTALAALELEDGS